MLEFRTRRRIEFADTDLGGIAHFSRYFVFMESAEHELLRSVGVEVHARREEGIVGWPRLATSCEYRSPARYGEELDIVVRVERVGRTSLTTAYELRCADRRVASGRMTSVQCVLDAPEGLRPLPLGPELARRLRRAAPPTPIR
jgi:acyl-CoA thioester hydrolase